MEEKIQELESKLNKLLIAFVGLCFFIGGFIFGIFLASFF